MEIFRVGNDEENFQSWKSGKKCLEMEIMKEVFRVGNYEGNSSLEVEIIIKLMNN